MHARILIAAAALTAAFLFVLLAVSQSRAHDIYHNWMRPDGSGATCCSGRDCYPTRAEYRAGSWYALRREDQKWVRVPGNLILKNEVTEDGKAHLCAPPPGSYSEVFCFKPPEAGT